MVYGSLELEVAAGDIPEGLDALMRGHNDNRENFFELDEALSKLLLQHGLFKSAIEGIGRGVVVEIGYHRAITLNQLAKTLSAELPGALVVGLDKGDYRPEVVSTEFFHTIPQRLLDTESNLGRDVFIKNWSGRARTIIYNHGGNPSAFAIYGVTAEQALLLDAADLIVLKAMFGYFGGNEAESLEYFRKNVLPRAKRFFIADYIGQCRFTKVRIPRPEAVAQTITAAYPNAHVSFQTGENHFVLYARR